MKPTTKKEDELEKLEIRLLLDGLYEYYGYDFRDYAPATLKRRVSERIRREQVTSVTGLLAKVLHDSDCMRRLVSEFSITVSSMFRDPGFFMTLRKEVVPMLKTFPFIRLWHAGCGNGEEVYSMAILLFEEGLYDRSQIFATDINETAIRKARAGIFPLEKMQKFTQNYIAAGGKKDLSDYYTARYGNAIFRTGLKKNLVFFRHCLTTHELFNEFNAIICRNVMIYFRGSLQARVHDLFYNSLVNFGFLGLGDKESIRFTPHESCYEASSRQEKIYKKIR